VVALGRAVFTVSEWWTSRSMSAVVQAAFGKTVGQSLKVKFVVRTTLRFSYRRLTTWKRREPSRSHDLPLPRQSDWSPTV
jgi:hypothetical protein